MTEKILVVDDDDNICELVRFYLDRWGYSCSEAGSAEEARARLEAEAFALLLTDIKMPGESGLDLTRHVKATYPDMIVIFLSVLEDQDTARAAMETGAYAYLTKPLRPNEMRLFLQNGLHRRRLEIELEKQMAGLEQKVHERTLKYKKAINELNVSKEAFQASEMRMRKIMEAVQAGIVIIDKSSRTIVEANPAALLMLEANEADVLGKACHAFICQSEEGQCPYVDPGTEARNSEAILLTAQGREVQILKTVVPFWVQKKEYLLESFVDISPLKQTEKKLHEAYADLENLFSSISSVLIQVTPPGAITKWNSRASAFFGLGEADVLGHSLLDLPVPWDREKLKEIIQQCRELQAPIEGNEMVYQDAEGKNRILGFSVSPCLDEAGGLGGILFMGADITERKNLESQLAQAQKLEAIGQLAAGIAHEINTPIQYVGDNTRFLKEAFASMSLILNQSNELIQLFRKGENLDQALECLEMHSHEADLDFMQAEIPTAIEQTLQGIDKVSAIVRSMKDFSHPGGEEKVPVDLNNALSSTGTISRNEWKYVADLEFSFEENLPMVPCLPGEMNQVFLNIIVNAAHAIAEVVNEEDNKKGKITVVTQSKDNEVEIRIADTGKGIPAKIRPFIFDPFYTTKGVGKGTGQGLALAHSTVVEKHGGDLTFETELGRGTTFIIRLPMENGA